MISYHPKKGKPGTGVKLWKYMYARLHPQINPRNGTKISLMCKSGNDKTRARGPQDKVKYMHPCMLI